MKEDDFLKTLRTGRILIVDGAMGTMLQARGMPAGTEPAAFCLRNPDILLSIHKAYIGAGADIVTTCTFGANACKLAPGANVFEMNRELAAIARQAVAESGRKCFVAGDAGPTGLFAKPLGTLEPMRLYEIFAEQIAGLAAGGADLIFVETQFDLAEARMAVAAARKACGLPVMVSMTFDGGASLTGSSPEIFAQTMQNLGADVVGTNCSLGPDQMLPIVRTLLEQCSCPVLVEPNAGLPELRDGVTVFPLPPAPFAEKTALFARMGAQVLGGCCGTTPDHIKALSEALAGFGPVRRDAPEESGIVLTSRSRLVGIGGSDPLVLIGERVNPTGKPVLAEELAKGKFAEAARLAEEQVKAGADVIDVNVGAPMVDEAAVLPGLVSLLIEKQLGPLSLDSSSPEAIKAAVPWCPGSCLVNSISGEKGRMELLGPVCRDFGAPFILLPLLGPTLPEKASERIAITETLLEQAQALGIPRRLIMVDVLALSVSSTQDAGKACLEMIGWCNSQGLPTVIGLSNISFGMPARSLLNSVFLAMARGAGLGCCIANPGAPLLREIRDAMLVLDGNEQGTCQFIEGYANWQNQGSSKPVEKKKVQSSSLYGAVLQGDKEQVESLVAAELESGRDPFAIVNESLIPAITEVGELYERREYFLPQLIRSAETMRKAFGVLRPLLEKEEAAGERPVVVMATVEGDIHDIGKNIVCLMLGNYGFEVIDAGKDVPAAEIVRIAEEHKARIIGLSALMTTTMPRMEDTIKLIRERGLPIRVMVGGAAVTQGFADSIGADAYCGDAMDSVRAARGFIGA